MRKYQEHLAFEQSEKEFRKDWNQPASDEEIEWHRLRIQTWPAMGHKRFMSRLIARCELAESGVGQTKANPVNPLPVEGPDKNTGANLRVSS